MHEESAAFQQLGVIHRGITRKLTRNHRSGDTRKYGRRFRIPRLAILRTADDTSLAVAGDLLRCNWLGRMGMIGGDAFRAV